MLTFSSLIAGIGQHLRNRAYSNIFDSRYLDGNDFYMNRFDAVPCLLGLGEVDTARAFDFISESYKNEIVNVYFGGTFNRDKNEQAHYNRFLVMKKKIMIEISYEFVEIFFSPSEHQTASDILNGLLPFKAIAKAVKFEINVITIGNDGLQLKPLLINETSLDINLYYNDDFKPVDELIRSRLKQHQDKGIILLHGLPGTGKTTYLRDLVGKLEKKVLFVSPSVAGNMMNPEFLDLLVDHPNSVLVIEDAENIIMDRKYNQNSSVSNLLNLSDGLMSDCLNVQIICTFNNAISMVDSALLRKGRLIARYEFGKLTQEKAQRLSDHLELRQVIGRPMTLAEISNPDEKDFSQPLKTQIGFNAVLEN